MANENERESYIPDDELAAGADEELAPGASAAMDGDRLGGDPTEHEMQAPEGWSAADKYGTTPFEQSHPRPLDERLAEERPDAPAEPPD